ncbi:MAG TPA: RyR domain-containing protein [Mycobacterium sp.]|nr:RyR domain-containing protein [Mycobacterium sp.]
MAATQLGSVPEKRAPVQVLRDGIARFVQSQRQASPLLRLQRFLDACYVLSIGYVSARALFPTLGTGLPDWIAWFGRPDSYPTIVVVLAFPLARIVVGRMAGQRLGSAPLFYLAVMAASAVVLGMSAYARCYGVASPPDPTSGMDPETPFFAPLGWTLALFAAAVEDRFGSDGAAACQHVPVALEIARILAIATTLTAGLAAALTLFRSQVDRFAIWRARSLTVVVGVDEDTVSMIRAISGTLGGGETLVAITKDANTSAAGTIRGLGAKVRVINLDEPETMARLRLWTRLDRLYLLSEDPVQNLRRFKVIDTELERLGDERVRLPLIVRIDDPWQAEVWRRSFLANINQRWVADAVGRYEVTASKLVRHMTTKRQGAQGIDPPSTVVLCGLHPLTYAMTSELAQLHRDQSLYKKPNVVPPEKVIIFAEGAQSFVDDHHMRQDRIIPGGGERLTVEALERNPTVDAIAEYLRDDTASHAVVLGDPSMETTATRLASRLPKLTVYVASGVSTSLVDLAIVGQLYSFPINMELDKNAPQDVWERAAELIHERFSAKKDRTKRNARPWPELDPFFRQSNRRQVHNTLWMVETIANHTWNTLESEAAEPLPENFDEMTPLEKLKALGFDEDTVDRMIQIEHEDWCRYYREGGWKYSANRDDDKNRHDSLKPWHQLKQERPDCVDNSRESLVGTLVSLRNLGYRSVPKSAQRKVGGFLQDVV